ncbi:Nse1 non-SMC component of SMC5-6 complex-domain-containing protein [Crassisporium funariophilum]|nr:Nse1 non-SMC component of SMC5-6 complex-domain-containing protein [Crassisporium funariophilum]
MVSASDVDRLFLQAVFSRGLLSTTLAQTLWEKSVNAVKATDTTLNIPHSKSKEAWHEYVAKINRSLDKLEFEFRPLHDETSGREMYALVNRKGDEIAQMATEYTPAEITFFKAIVEQIMLAPREAFSVSSLAALRELNAAKLSMTKSQAEVVLASFVSKGWLMKSKRGRYSLSTRSLLELLPYLKSTFPDEIIECTICMEIMTRGIACYTPNCETRMHNHCFTTYRRRNTSCPSCDKEWPAEAKAKPLIPVGEDAAQEGGEGRRQTRFKSVDSSDDEEEFQEEDQEPTPVTAPKKESRRGSQNKAPSENSMEVDDTGDVPTSQSQGTQRTTRRSTRR